MMAALKKVWEWLKAHWKYILFPVAAVLGLLAIGRRRSSVVVAPELVEAEKTRRAAQEAEDQKRVAAGKERAEKLLAIEVEHAETIKQLTDQQKVQAEQLKADPAKLNSYLKDVGRSMR